MTLRHLAHTRAGDKGNIVNVSVIAYDASDFPLLIREVTAERVRAHLADLVIGDVIRYELPHLAALNFVLRRPPRDSVTQSLALDAHGKSFSSALLDFEVSDTL